MKYLNFSRLVGLLHCRITGVKWVLGDTACGIHRLNVPAPLTRRSGKSWVKDVKPEQRLTINVLDALPQLSARIGKLPGRIHDHSLVPCELKIGNKSDVPCESLYLASSSSLASADATSIADSELGGFDLPPPPGKYHVFHRLFRSLVMRNILIIGAALEHGVSQQWKP